MAFAHSGVGGFVAGDRYIGFSSPEQEFVSVDLNSGQVAWQTRLGPVAASAPFGPVAGDVTVFGVYLYGVLYGFSVSDARLLWSREVKTSIAPSISGKRPMCLAMMANQVAC